MRAALRQFFSGARVSWGIYLANLRPAVFFFATIPRTLFQALFFVFLAQAAGGSDLAKFALIGNAVHVAAFMAIIFIAGAIEMEKWSGTLAFVIAAPTKWLPSMIGRSMADYTHALFNSAIILFVFIPFFAPGTLLTNLLRSAPLFILTLASVSTLGWIVGALALPVRWGTTIANIVGYIMLLVCGINLPLQALPEVVQQIAHWIPLTNGVLAIRAVVDGSSYMSVLPLIGRELLVGMIFGIIGWQAFQYRLNVTRKTGAFEVM